MAESGCLRDVHAQDLEVAGNTRIGSNSSKTIVDSHLVSLGSRKIQTFSVSLADTNAAATAYADNDCLVELGTLNTNLSSAFTAATRIFIHKAVVYVKTKAGETLVGNLQLSDTSGTATNGALTNATEIVGAGVTAFSSLDSAAVIAAAGDAVGPNADEIDINLDGSNNSYHIFTPNVDVDINRTHLYLCTTTTINADITAGRYTVELEYSVM